MPVSGDWMSADVCTLMDFIKYNYEINWIFLRFILNKNRQTHRLSTFIWISERMSGIATVKILQSKQQSNGGANVNKTNYHLKPKISSKQTIEIEKYANSF